MNAVSLIGPGLGVRAGSILLLWFAISVLIPEVKASAWSVRWNTNSNQVLVEVIGLSEEMLRQLQAANWQVEDWQKLLPIYASREDSTVRPDVPGMLGSYCVADGFVRFRPRFPLEPGLKYLAVFRPANLPGNSDPQATDMVSTFHLPTKSREATTVVTWIYPSANALPENLLKFYLHFSAPMRRGHIYEHVELRDDAGQRIELPFLEIDEELWNPEMTRLTLFIDPGRIKRGVQPLEEIGPVFEAGKGYTLVIDSGWRDDQGNPLKETYRKSFRAGPSQREPIDMANWKITAPPAGSVAPVRVGFPAPLDHALALRMIGVKDTHGHTVSGEASLGKEEREWSFAPAKAWVAGRYELAVQTTIEDLAGNNVGKSFEVDLFETARPRLSPPSVSKVFEVK